MSHRFVMMNFKAALLLVMCHLYTGSDGFIFGTSTTHAGKPLFLSPYIARRDIQTAQSLSLVSQLPGQHTAVKSYSGFIEVQPQYNNNLFFWYIPAQTTDPNKAPLFLWLDGGPGASSLLSMFNMNGPYMVDEHDRLRSRTLDWTKKFSIIYLDSPVGTGFSFTDDVAGYAQNETDVARDLYSFLTQFFTLFPNLRSNDFYIGGESYSGKYIPAIGYKIHTENPTAVNRINLKGLLMGAPFTDPVTIAPVYPDVLYNAGMLNLKETAYFRSEVNRSVQSAKSGDGASAGQIILPLLFGPKGYFTKHTGYQGVSSILQDTIDLSYSRYVKFVNRSDVRRAIHVGETPYFASSQTVFQHLTADFMRGYKPWLITLLNSKQYKILIYGGQFDIIVCTPCIEAMINKFDSWTDIDDYRQADKIIWRLKPDDKDVAGYVTRVGNFTRVIVRGAGHDAIGDQPERCMDVVTRFIDDRRF